MTLPAPIPAIGADRDAGPGCVVGNPATPAAVPSSAAPFDPAPPRAGHSWERGNSTNRTLSSGERAVSEDGSGRATEHPAAKDEHDHARQHGVGGPASRSSGASQHTETHRRCAGAGGPPASPAPAKRAPTPCRLFTAEGVEVFVSQVCTKCHRMKPLAAFGLRRMADGKIRSIPQCKVCRGGEPRDRRQVPMFPRSRKGTRAA